MKPHTLRRIWNGVIRRRAELDDNPDALWIRIDGATIWLVILTVIVTIIVVYPQCGEYLEQTWTNLVSGGVGGGWNSSGSGSGTVGRSSSGSGTAIIVGSPYVQAGGESIFFSAPIVTSRMFDSGSSSVPDQIPWSSPGSPFSLPGGR